VEALKEGFADMSVLLLLVSVSLALAALAVAACLISLRAGQFDDLESPKWRMLFDSTASPNPRSREPRT
jgi:cbb3-type cytochrome oxidase maturation protein